MSHYLALMQSDVEVELKSCTYPFPRQEIIDAIGQLTRGMNRRWGNHTGVAEFLVPPTIPKSPQESSLS